MENQNTTTGAGLPAAGQSGGPRLLQPTADQRESSFKSVILPAVIILAIILGGAATGYVLANRGLGGSAGSGGPAVVSGEKAVSGSEELGLKDEKSFPDKAQGRLEVNQSKTVTEGSHQLVRPGGPSQTAFLTSSVVDLGRFEGKCVEIWGETFAAQSAGWFLDVGYVKKLDQCPEGI